MKKLFDGIPYPEKNGFMSTRTVHKDDWGHGESTDAYRWFL